MTLGIIEMRERYKSQSREIIVPFELDLELNNIVFTVPQRGDKKKLLDLSILNVKQYKADRLKQAEKLNPEQRSMRLMKEIQQELHLDRPPLQIECFDNSNIQGSDAVAACVVFKKAKPSKKDYRKYNIKTVVGPDDYASMKEVVRRRYQRVIEENAPLPDLIITDIVMAGASGLELVNAVRSDKFLRGIPVVVVSAKITESEQVEGLVSGADAYLTKPFSVPVLCATVERLIASRRMLKDYYNTPESVYTVVEGQKMHQTDKLFMDTVVDTIQEHIESENLRMELIAERLGLTARNFYRKFKKISGRTPSEFIKEYRFEYAARLLTTTHLTIQEIMYRVGISNKSYFYREFQKKYGLKPKEYRTKQ